MNQRDRFLNAWIGAATGCARALDAIPMLHLSSLPRDGMLRPVHSLVEAGKLAHGGSRYASDDYELQLTSFDRERNYWNGPETLTVIKEESCLIWKRPSRTSE